MGDDRFVDEKVIEKFLGVGPLKYWRYHKKGPPFYRIGGRVRYLLDEVKAWAVSRRVDETKKSR